MHIEDREFLALGVPQDQLTYIRSLKTIQQFYESKSSLPEDAYEGLEWVVNGFPVKEVLELFSDKNDNVSQDKNFAAALQNPRSQKNFVVVDGEEELRRMVAEPLEKCRFFLHQAQRKIVNKNYSGAARV